MFVDSRIVHDRGGLSGSLLTHRAASALTAPVPIIGPCLVAQALSLISGSDIDFRAAVD
jgi:hypothetical protein